MGRFAQAFAAAAAYGALHSLLLTGFVRRLAERAAGATAVRGWFRFAYNVQAVVLLVALGVYVSALPDRQLLTAGPWVSSVLWALRASALAFIGYCLAATGVAEFLGVADVLRSRRGEAPTGREAWGGLVTGGPYRWVRHPMYAAGFVALWAEPHWTENRVAVAAAFTLYLWLGTLHEERRLLAEYGEAYRRYCGRTPRFLPRLRPRP